MDDLDKLFELAFAFRENGALRDAIEIFNKILNEYPHHNKAAGVYTIIGGMYRDLKEYENALVNFRTATELNPKYELASQALYITYANLDRNEEAIAELFRYLRQFPADGYKTSLEELLEGLEQGYMTDYENEINELARINGVTLPGKNSE